MTAVLVVSSCRWISGSAGTTIVCDSAYAIAPTSSTASVRPYG